MKIEKEWSASSEKEKNKTEDLINVAYHWGISIKFYINKPFYYSQGPIKQKITIRELPSIER